MADTAPRDADSAGVSVYSDPPTKRRNRRCRRGHHKVRVQAINFDGHLSYREGPCERCGARMQQHLSYFGKPTGPWREDVRPPCTHGTEGRPVMACMNCAVERQNRGLR